MTRTIKLNGHVDDESVIVELFDKSYRLRPITRSVQRKLADADRQMNELQAGDNADLDQVVGLLAEGLDVLLEIDGGHRTPASKIIREKWSADKLTTAQLQGYYEQLTEVASERPT